MAYKHAGDEEPRPVRASLLYPRGRRAVTARTVKNTWRTLNRGRSMPPPIFQEMICHAR
jgi:hypothetical protein